MLVTLDNLASRYGILPSQALAQATTLDLIVLNTSTQWENYRYEQANRKPGEAPSAPNLSQDEMLAMIQQVRSK